MTLQEHHNGEQLDHNKITNATIFMSLSENLREWLLSAFKLTITSLVVGSAGVAGTILNEEIGTCKLHRRGQGSYRDRFVMFGRLFVRCM